MRPRGSGSSPGQAPRHSADCSAMLAESNDLGTKKTPCPLALWPEGFPACSSSLDRDLEPKVDEWWAKQRQFQLPSSHIYRFQEVYLNIANIKHVTSAWNGACQPVFNRLAEWFLRHSF
jgi:hypothetical protein